MRIAIFIFSLITFAHATEEPKKITKTSISAEGSIQGGNTPFTLLGSQFKHLFSISRHHDFSFSAGAQYQKIADNDIRTAHIGMNDDLLIKEDYVFFTALKLKRNDIKSQRLWGAAMFGGGYDFLGQYNRGNDAKYTIGFGYQHENTRTTNYNDLIFTHRFKYDYLTNKTWGLAITLWLKHVIYSGESEEIISFRDAFDTLESSLDFKLTQKHFLGRQNLHFFISTSAEYDNMPIPGTKFFNYLVKLGFDYLLSEK